ncbi:MAG TPA: hypothetical protein VMT03_03550 [Polyangia bacterium]|nr:hypothetical protein [Polyangia bacterium]
MGLRAGGRVLPVLTALLLAACGGKTLTTGGSPGLGGRPGLGGGGTKGGGTSSGSGGGASSGGASSGGAVDDGGGTATGDAGRGQVAAFDITLEHDADLVFVIDDSPFSRVSCLVN